MTKLCIPRYLLSLVIETERWAACVEPLSLMLNERYGGCFTVLASYVRKLCLNRMRHLMGNKCSLPRMESHD